MHRRIHVVQPQPRKYGTMNARKIDWTVLTNTRQSRSYLQSGLLSVVLFNAQLLNNKFNDFEATFYSQFNDFFHLIAVTETWFSSSNPACARHLPLFRQFHCNHNGVFSPISTRDHAVVILRQHQWVQSVKPRKISFLAFSGLLYPCFGALDNTYGLVSIKRV